MDFYSQNCSDNFTHSLSTSAVRGLCPEMLDVAQTACQAGDYNFAAEIYSSQLVDLQRPDRALCLLKADALSKAGRIGEALDSYCFAANLDSLRPEELGSLVDCITHSLRERELLVSAQNGLVEKNELRGAWSETDKYEDEEPLDIFSCQSCKCLLSDPVTLECGHSYCKYCLECEHVKECTLCRNKQNKTTVKTKANGFKANVVLSGLLEKWFGAESEARKYWLEGERLRTKHNLLNALEKYNKAVETGRL